MGVFDIIWLATSLRSATPLILAASGELVSQRAGVLNIGLEGMMLVGAFFGFYGVFVTGSAVLGTLFGVVAGLLLACLVALLTIHARADQIVVGIGVNILALGTTSFLLRVIFERGQARVERPPAFRLTGLADLPVLGPVLFRHPLLVYVSLLVIVSVGVLLYRTTLGMSIRAAGELPEAVDTAGISTARIRWIGTLTAGALAGMGGAYLSTHLGTFIEGMTAGRGFLAIAAVIFGRWHPAGVFIGCLVFGAATALQLRLQGQPFVPVEVWLLLALAVPAYLLISRWRSAGVAKPGLAVAGALSGLGVVLFVAGPQWSLPAQLWRTLPYVLTLAVLAGAAGKSRMPTALGTPYRRGE